MVLYYLVSTIYVLVCVMLLMVILLQQGKGDMAAAFGGGSSNSAFGARTGATLLSKVTAGLAAAFMRRSRWLNRCQPDNFLFPLVLRDHLVRRRGHVLMICRPSVESPRL